MNDLNEMTLRGDEAGLRGNEQRTPEQIGAEIRMYVDTGRRISLLCGIEIGRRLVEAKELLGHGEWLPWLEKETEFSSSSAQRYMKLFDEYGASQLGLFGPETNTPTLGNLPISKALALLSVPESDREAFAEQVDAEHISVRELEEKIRERERQIEVLRKDIEGEKQRGDEAIREKMETEDLLKTQDGMLAEAQAKIRELAKLNDELEHRPVEVAVETVRDEAAITEAVEKAKEDALKESERAQEGLLKQLAAAEKQRKDLQAKLEQAEKDLKAKENALADAEKKGSAAGKKEADELRRTYDETLKEMNELRKQLKASNADVAVFGLHFKQIQTEFNAMTETLRKIREIQGDETADKLLLAARTLLSKLLEATGGNGGGSDGSVEEAGQG